MLARKQYHLLLAKDDEIEMGAVLRHAQDAPYTF